MFPLSYRPSSSSPPSRSDFDRKHNLATFQTQVVRHYVRRSCIFPREAGLESPSGIAVSPAGLKLCSRLAGYFVDKVRMVGQSGLVFLPS